MYTKQVAYTLALLAAVAGLALMLESGTARFAPTDFLALHQFEIGAYTLALAPLVLRRYRWLVIQLAITTAYFVWLYLY